VRATRASVRPHRGLAHVFTCRQQVGLVESQLTGIQRRAAGSAGAEIEIERCTHTCQHATTRRGQGRHCVVAQALYTGGRYLESLTEALN
jgi:hypothetical protein